MKGLSGIALDFAKWLGASKLGDVNNTGNPGRHRRDPAGLGAWVSLAHPWHYDFTRSKRRKLIGDYIGAGGHAVVVNGHQPAEQVGSLAILAREFDALVSAGSDFHGPGGWSEIGEYRPVPKTCRSCGGDSSMTPLLPPSEQVEHVSQFFQIHPENPQARLIKQAVEIIRAGGAVIYPAADSSSPLVARLATRTVERVRRLRGLDKDHNFALICSDLSQLGLFAKVDTGTFRLLQARTPGPYTFILNATREVPRLLLHPKKRTIGLRVPEHPIAGPCWPSWVSR